MFSIHPILRWSDCKRFFANNHVSRLVFYGVMLKYTERQPQITHGGAVTADMLSRLHHITQQQLLHRRLIELEKTMPAQLIIKKHRRENQAPKLCSVDVYAKRVSSRTELVSPLGWPWYPANQKCSIWWPPHAPPTSQKNSNHNKGQSRQSTEMQLHSAHYTVFVAL